jgi:tetratricopeptide (TPR) repeat protein
VIRGALVVVAIGLVAGTAHAESKADKLFAKGKKLLAQKKYEEACKAFEQSDGIDTEIGTKLNVARCYEEWGKVASALHWYQDAEQLAKDKKDPRAAKIKGIEDALDPDVPRLTIKANENADVETLRLDGATTKINEALPVDPGPHELAWTNADGKAKTKLVPLEKGGSSEVKVDLPKRSKWKGKPGEMVGEGKKPEGEAEPAPVPEAPPGDGNTQRLAGIAVAGAGLVAVGVASALTLGARTKYNNALKADCMNDRTMCDDAGLTATAAARHRANVSTVVALLGVGAMGGGALLYFLAPHGTAAAAAKSEHAFYLVPQVDSDGAAVLLGGRF